MRKVAFYTLGCKVNQYDTEAVVEQFKALNYEVVDFSEWADVYVVNTCTVTHLSDRKCRQMLRKTKRINADSILVAMGCYAQIAADSIKEQVEEIDIIVGTNNRSDIPRLVEAFDAENRHTVSTVTDIMEVTEFEELHISDMGERTRVYLKVQEGCNNYCSYCIIPYTRGKLKSRKKDSVLVEAKRLVSLGYKEIVLTGIHVLAYGKDLGDTDLLDLIEAIHDIEGLERIRMSSIEPVAVTEAFINTLKRLPKVCHHFHLSLQSGCNRTLRRMNRKYTAEEYLESVHRLRELWADVAITTDIIVGFPDETEEDFKETLVFVEKAQLAQVHIFPFSPREGTPAAKMKNQVSPEIKDKRVKELSVLERRLRYAFMEKYIGKQMLVLFEKYHNNYVMGYTSNYLKVQVNGNEDLENTLQLVNMRSVDEDGHLLGNI